MRFLALALLVALGSSLSGCSPVPLTLNDKTIVFSHIDTVQVGAAESVVYSKGAFVVKSRAPVTVNGREVLVSGDSVSVGGNRFEVGKDYQVRVAKDGAIHLEWIQPSTAAVDTDPAETETAQNGS